VFSPIKFELNGLITYFRFILVESNITMVSKTYFKKSYFDLTEHNTLQISLFMLIALLSAAAAFFLILPLFENFFTDFLTGDVMHDGKFYPYSLEAPEPQRGTSYLFSWAVDIYKNTAEESRYWFNPLMTLMLPALFFGMLSAIFFSSLMPRNLGYMRQKIEREIISFMDKIAVAKYGFLSEGDNEEILEELLHANLQDLHRYEEEWNIPLEDIKTVRRAIKWVLSPFWKKVFTINEGFRIYMRFHFTVQFSNTVLGLVYMGAAVLIIIIGLRGIKFIPPKQPSLVLFALGLEFTLLVTYAVTLIYTKEEEEPDYDNGGTSPGDTLMKSNELGSSRDVEKLLKVFINSSKKKSG
jgi:hypothetical protein